jgi:hypothetical protein
VSNNKDLELMKAQSKTEPQITMTPERNPLAANQSASKTGPIAKIKNQKDTFPVTKTPKRQKSSRFHISEKVKLEPLQLIKGTKT